MKLTSFDTLGIKVTIEDQPGIRVYYILVKFIDIFKGSWVRDNERSSIKVVSIGVAIIIGVNLSILSEKLYRTAIINSSTGRRTSKLEF